MLNKLLAKVFGILLQISNVFRRKCLFISIFDILGIIIRASRSVYLNMRANSFSETPFHYEDHILHSIRLIQICFNHTLNVLFV